jgi:glycogen debranching enzyme
MAHVSVDAARAVLRANDRGGYTVPAARLYPFQWNWDAGFAALGFATFDEPRAWTELDTLFRGQWEDGLLPQIVFHAPSDDYFPGPAVWRTPPRDPATSGITQPPVHAIVVRRLLENAHAWRLAEARAERLYKKLVAAHDWWWRARDPGHTGLVHLLHPWESGMDNSPASDEALARVPMTTTTEIRRRDTGHVDPAMRPRDQDYRRFIHLVDRFADCGWDPARMWAASPFRVADIGVNAILLRAEEDLHALAGRFGTPGERARLAERVDAARRAVAATWSDELGVFRSVDFEGRAPIDAPTSAGFLPLLSGAPSLAQAAALAATLDRWAGPGDAILPSVPPDHPRHEPRRYWRGPIWAVVNWMVAEGFARHGEPASVRLRLRTRRLIERGGFAEYFDPRDGAGLGGGPFTWTAAVYLMLAG